MTVFPPRNLPGEANEWGRAVEAREKLVASRIRDFTQSSNNSHRAEAGQLAVSSGNIEELLNRRLDVIKLSDMSVSGSATVDPFPSATQIATFESVLGGRSGFLTFNADFTVSPLRGTPVVVFLRYSGGRLLRLTPKITPDTAINPVESQGVGSIFGFCRVPVPNNQPLNITVELVRGPDATSSEITLSQGYLTLTRSGAA